MTDYFDMTGGKASDLSFTPHTNNANAQVAISGSVLTLAGITAGSTRVTITAYDKAGGRPTQGFNIVVGVANRAPVSDKAIGNPTINVGATRTYMTSMTISAILTTIV